MAIIKTLKDNELIGGTDNSDVYPISSTQAIYSQKADGTIPEGIKHQKLEDRLEDIEDDAVEIHGKIERLVVSLSNDQANQTLEIDDVDNTIHLSGEAHLENFGDVPATTINPEDMTIKKITVSSGSAVIEEVNSVTLTYNLPNVVGTYTSRFDCTYNGVSKHDESITNVNLRKYFGFAESAPADVIGLATSHFSNSVNCTVTIPAALSGTEYQRIYFAVPNGMTISRIVQPDALNAPLAFSLVGTVTRTVNGTSYTYKLYQSTDLIDSSENKRLTIS